ncbi:hypothetical protein [Qipengyuania marisflavi]|uniref:Uncharacterized protein n=1 Tax=Qipengyuania marisflavi TaxID=2486356 RepID=A0A5S3PNH6_9SPHN|nr:hypothetical protein [Qipengyuania marisflavi]TMM44985.1 hypothetical protein FEV51_13000 [Qipengyuania marisflavi]
MRFFSAGEFCEIEQVKNVKEGMPSWANLKSRIKRAPEMVGAGIYACFWDRELIYIGLHVGPEANPFGVSVSDRLHKHILGFTLRAHNLSFSNSGLKSILAELNDPSGVRSSIATDLAGLDPAIVTRDKGLSSTFNKARFAARHWEELANAPAAEIMDRFEAGFSSVDCRFFRDMSKGEINLLISREFEKPTIHEFEPCCNTDMRSCDGKPVGLNEVADFVTRTISSWQNLNGTRRHNIIAQTQEAVAQMKFAGKDDPEDDTGTILDPDERYLEYYTPGGQWRVKSAQNGRVLAVGSHKNRVSCLASPARLTALGIVACNTAPSETIMKSVVELEPMEMEGNYARVLKTVIEASLAELEHLTL